MRVVIQRVSKASVRIQSETHARIGRGLLVLLGVETGDMDEDVEYLAGKIIKMRIFNDHNGKMNCSVEDVKGSLLVVSQFTLLADTRKGRRPSYNRAAPPPEGEQRYMQFVECLRQYDVHVETGVFGAMMEVELVNDGPVTILIESRNR